MSMDIEDQLMRERKRARFTDGQPAGPRRGVWVVVAVAVVLLLGMGAWYWGGSPAEAPPSAAAPAVSAHEAAVAENGAFRIPLADLASGQAKFFEHKPADAAAHPVRFFAIKSSDGTHRVALDACEVCYAARKGYQQNGIQMLCRKCGLSFPSEVIDQTAGGCHPIAVPRATEGTDLVVKTADVEAIDAKYAALAAAPRRPTMPQRSSPPPLLAR